MESHNIEFEVRFDAEVYANETETIATALERGNFQFLPPTLLRWRTYQLDDAGDVVGYGQWNDVRPLNITINKFSE